MKSNRIELSRIELNRIESNRIDSNRVNEIDPLIDFADGNCQRADVESNVIITTSSHESERRQPETRELRIRALRSLRGLRGLQSLQSLRSLRPIRANLPIRQLRHISHSFTRCNPLEAATDPTLATRRPIDYI